MTVQDPTTAMSEVVAALPVETSQAMPDTEADLALLARFEPVLRLTEGELFRPGTVEDYLRDAALLQQHADGPVVLAEPGTLTPDRLAALGREHRASALSLRFVQRPMTRAEHRDWRGRQHRAPFTKTNAAAAAGLVARVVAAVMRLSLLVRGRIPGGHTAVAYDQAAPHAPARTAHYYGRVSRDGGFTALQYWFFYPMNDWRSTFGGVNDHEADWEQVTVFVVETPDAVVPAWVAFASHDEKGADLRRRWDDPDLQTVGEHPVAFIGAGSHSAACVPGDYLVRVAPDLPGWLAVLRSRLARILPWWDPASAGLGIPFVDYRRGDGPSIGPGLDLEWTRELIDDRTPWAADYQGLWGLDTGDPLGGERAPAGPRYERDGTVRQCWRRPVTWAALDEESPGPDAEARLWQQRPDTLRAARASAAADLDLARTHLRTTALAARAGGGRTEDARRELRRLRHEVASLDARISVLDADLAAIADSAGPVPTPPDPQEHLSGRPVPLELDGEARSAALRVWSSASAAILFAALGLLMVFGSSSLLWPVLALVVAMLLVEAAVRRKLLAFITNLALAAVAVVLAWAVVRLLLDNVRAGVGVLLIAAAVYMAGQGATQAVVRRQLRDPSPEPGSGDAASPDMAPGDS